MKPIKRARGYLRMHEAKPKLLQVPFTKEEKEVNDELDKITKQATESFEDFSCFVGIVAARQAYKTIQDILDIPRVSTDDPVILIDDIRKLVDKRIDQFDIWINKVKKDMTESPTTNEQEDNEGDKIESSTSS